MTSRPSVVSISWGSGETGYLLDHMQAANAEFMKMGLAGISVLTASGDDGTFYLKFYIVSGSLLLPFQIGISKRRSAL